MLGFSRPLLAAGRAAGRLVPWPLSPSPLPLPLSRAWIASPLATTPAAHFRVCRIHTSPVALARPGKKKSHKSRKGGRPPSKRRAHKSDRKLRKMQREAFRSEVQGRVDSVGSDPGAAPSGVQGRPKDQHPSWALKKTSARRVKDYLEERASREAGQQAERQEEKRITAMATAPEPSPVSPDPSPPSWSFRSSAAAALNGLFSVAATAWHGQNGKNTSNAQPPPEPSEGTGRVPQRSESPPPDRPEIPMSRTQLNRLERLESEARVVSQAIQQARERGMTDDDDTFFYPYPEGSPPAEPENTDSIWLYLGPEPENWGKDVPPVPNRWLETLSLGLTKSIVALDEGGRNGYDDEFVESLVDDYDLEDHERLEQLGDSIVNMSSRLLAYQTYPDVHEGTLTKLGNYPTQNNILGILFHESGLNSRRLALQEELRQRAGNLARRTRGDDGAEAEPESTAEGDGATNQVGKLASQHDEARATSDDPSAHDAVQPKGRFKRDADMFEAYVAAVFLSHDCDFSVVHNWLTPLFRPFQDQAFRFMVQKSEAAARRSRERMARDAAVGSSDGGKKPSKQEASAEAEAGAEAESPWKRSSLYKVLLDPILQSLAAASSARPKPPPQVGGGLGSKPPTPESLIRNDMLTVAARARRQREVRLAEEARLRDQQELMNMGYFKKGFLNLRQGFQRYVLHAEEEGPEASEREKMRQEKDKWFRLRYKTAELPGKRRKAPDEQEGKP